MIGSMPKTHQLELYEARHGSIVNDQLFSVKLKMNMIRAISFKNTWGWNAHNFRPPSAMIFFSCKPPPPTNDFFSCKPPPTNDFHYFFETPYPMCVFSFIPLILEAGVSLVRHVRILNVIHCRRELHNADRLNFKSVPYRHQANNVWYYERDWFFGVFRVINMSAQFSWRRC